MFVFSRQEVTVGHCWQQYRALGMYVRGMVRGIDLREEKAWYLFMTHEAVLDREITEAACFAGLYRYDAGE